MDVMESDVLASRLAALLTRDPSRPVTGETVEALIRLRSQTDAAVTGLVAAFDASQSWVPDGARSAATWMTARCRVPRSDANGVIRRGRLRSLLPVAFEAWREGEITAAHLDVLAGARTPATAEQLTRDETMLVGHARRLSFADFRRAVEYWRMFADPDGAESRAERQHRSRRVDLEQSFEGMWMGRMTFDPINGEIVRNELHRLERRLYESDWAEAKARLGREPIASELRRSSAQRLADALVEMARRSASSEGDGQGSRPCISVLVDYPTIKGPVLETARGTVIPPGSLLGLLDEAMVERAVFASPRRVEVSAASRFFSGASRRGIELRDRRCVHPMCDVCASRCQVDHLIPYARGGPTVQENGRLLCAFHNRLRERPDPAPFERHPPEYDDPEVDTAWTAAFGWEDEPAGHDEVSPPGPGRHRPGTERTWPRGDQRRPRWRVARGRAGRRRCRRGRRG
jgi:hypothetical protein